MRDSTGHTPVPDFECFSADCFEKKVEGRMCDENHCDKNPLSAVDPCHGKGACFPFSPSVSCIKQLVRLLSLQFLSSEPDLFTEFITHEIFSTLPQSVLHL